MPADIEAGIIDATFGALWGWEGLYGKVAGAVVQGRGIAELGVPPYPGQVLVTTRQRWEAGRNDADHFVGALGRAYLAAAAARTEAVDLIHEIAPYFRRELFEASFDEVTPTWSTADGSWGALPREPLERYAGWLLDEGLVSRPVTLERHFAGLDGDRLAMSR